MKKSFFALLLLPLSASAVTVTDPSLVRLRDNKGGPCAEAHESGRATYALSDLAVQASGSNLILSFSTNFMACVRNGNDVSLQPRLPLDTVPFTDGKGETVEIDFTDPEFLLGTENFQRLAALPAPNTNPQRVVMHTSIKQALSSEQKADLAAGKLVTVRLSVVFWATGRASGKDGYTLLGRRSQGAYTVFFKLRK